MPVEEKQDRFACERKARVPVDFLQGDIGHHLSATMTTPRRSPAIGVGHRLRLLRASLITMSVGSATMPRRSYEWFATTWRS